jgi:hypothetical protein
VRDNAGILLNVRPLRSDSHQLVTQKVALLMLNSHNFTKRYTDSQQASYVRTRKSPGGILDMVDLVRPGGDFPHPLFRSLS